MNWIKIALFILEVSPKAAKYLLALYDHIKDQPKEVRKEGTKIVKQHFESMRDEVGR